MARWLMISGAALLVLGALLYFVPGLFSWFGRLPGDINVESEKGKLFVPITSMLVVSALLTVLFNLFKR